MQTLAGWQKHDRPSTPVWARRLIVGLLLVCMLSAFAYLLRTPYERATVQVIVLAPKQLARGPGLQQAREQSRANSHSNRWDQIDIDLSNLLCQANGRHVEQGMRSSWPHGLLPLKGSQLKQQSQALQAELTGTLRPQSTLVLYVSGVLSSENKQPAICDRAHDATHGGSELLLMPLVESLQKVACRQILLCIDLVPPSHAAPSVMAAPLLVDQLSESLEQVLASHAGRTPLAVCLQLNSIDQVIKHGWTATPLASALASSLQTEAKTGVFELNRLKNHLAYAVQSQAVPAALPDAIWLTSIHWPANCDSIRLPSVALDNDARDGLELKASQTSQDELDPESLVDIQLDQLDQLDTERLRRVGRLAIRLFDRLELPNTEEMPAAWLPLPAALSYRQRHPYTTAWLEHQWQDLEVAHRLSADAVDPECLSSMVRAMVSLTTAQSKQLDLSPQIGMDLYASQDIKVEATNSLIANAAIVSITSLKTDNIGQAFGLLRQLTCAIDQSVDAKQCQDTLAKLASSHSQQMLEVNRCRQLCDVGLPWPTLQRLLRLYLVSARTKVDLFQDLPHIEPLISEADDLVRRIRNEVDLRPDSHPDAELDRMIERAMRSYRAAIDRMTAHSQASLQHRASICQMLSEHAWTRMSGSSNKAARQALQLFASDWQQLSTAPNGGAHVADAQRQRGPDIADEVEKTQASLADPASTRERQVAALLQLNRQTMAAAESMLIGAAAENAEVAERQSANIEPGAVRLFLRLISSDRTRPAQTWIDEALKRMVENNAQKTLLQLQGATVAEQAELQPWLEVWDQLAGSLRAKGLAVQTCRQVDRQLSVVAPTRVDLQLAQAVTIPCSVTYEATAVTQPQVTADFDQESLQVILKEQPNAGRSQRGADPAAASARFLLSVKRIADRPVKEPIVLLVSHGQSQRRAVIHLDTAQPSMVDVCLASPEMLNPGNQSRNQMPRCLLLPNRQQAVALQVRSSQKQPLTVDAQVWATTSPLQEPPAGALEKSVAQAWIDQQPALVALAQATRLTLDAESSRTISLMPSNQAPDLKQLPLRCTGMLIAITDSASQRMQFEYIPLHVRHPRDYVQQQVAWNAELQTIEVDNCLRASAAFDASQSVTLSHRLVEWPQLNEIARAGGQLMQAAPTSQFALTTNRSRSSQLILITEVDGWPGLWINVIDRAHNRISDQPFTHIAMSSQLSESTVPVAATEVTVNLTTWSNLQLGDEGTVLDVGWDRNRDRTLVAEPSQAISSLPAITASYLGIDPTGSILLDCSVKAEQLKVPVAGLMNERVSLLAVLRQGDRHLCQTELPIIVDRQQPTVQKVHVENGDHCLLGKPLVVNVQTDDQGLAGLTRVEGIWSLDGRVHIDSEMQTLPGVLRSDGAWLVTLPTAALPAGDNLLLLRAVDRAGNVSETYRLYVRLRSQQELDEMAAKATSVVTGSLMFAKLPLAGLKIELLKQPETKELGVPAGKPEVSEGELPVVATTTSLDDGSFRLSDIPSGRYQLRVSGVVRGMRTVQSRVLTVEAPQPLAPILWRLDKQP